MEMIKNDKEKILYNSIKDYIINNNNNNNNNDNNELKNELMILWNDSVKFVTNDNDNDDNDNELELISILRNVKSISELEKHINEEMHKPITMDSNTNAFNVKKLFHLFKTLDNNFNSIPTPNTEIGNNIRYYY
jgi:Na+/phosphate symporter